MLDKAAEKSCFMSFLDGNAQTHHAFALVASDLVLAARQHTLVVDLLVAGLALQLSTVKLLNS
jgi:hypothetical protein